MDNEINKYLFDIQESISSIEDYLVPVYKLAKVLTMWVSVQKVPIARLAKPPKAEFTHVNEYFGGKPVCRFKSNKSF